MPYIVTAIGVLIIVPILVGGWMVFDELGYRAGLAVQRRMPWLDYATTVGRVLGNVAFFIGTQALIVWLSRRLTHSVVPSSASCAPFDARY
jgi:hypothetical protein